MKASRCRFVVLCALAFAVVVFFCGCTEEEIAKAEAGANRAENMLNMGAGLTVGTPVAPILGLLALGAGVVGKLLGRKKKQKEIVMAKQVVVAPGFFQGRKNRMTAIGLVAAGLAILGASQEWFSPELAKSALAVISVVCGVNIAGIAYEDGKEKGAM